MGSCKDVDSGPDGPCCDESGGVGRAACWEDSGDDEFGAEEVRKAPGAAYFFSLLIVRTEVL